MKRSDGLTKVIIGNNAGNSRRQSKKGQVEKELDWQHRGVNRQILRRDLNHGTQPAGVERTDEEVRHDALLRLLAELRDQGRARQRNARSCLRFYRLNPPPFPTIPHCRAHLVVETLSMHNTSHTNSDLPIDIQPGVVIGNTLEWKRLSVIDFRYPTHAIHFIMAARTHTYTHAHTYTHTRIHTHTHDHTAQHIRIKQTRGSIRHMHSKPRVSLDVPSVQVSDTTTHASWSLSQWVPPAHANSYFTLSTLSQMLTACWYSTGFVHGSWLFIHCTQRIGRTLYITVSRN